MLGLVRSVGVGWGWLPRVILECVTLPSFLFSSSFPLRIFYYISPFYLLVFCIYFLRSIPSYCSPFSRNLLLRPFLPSSGILPSVTSSLLHLSLQHPSLASPLLYFITSLTLFSLILLFSFPCLFSLCNIHIFFHLCSLFSSVFHLSPSSLLPSLPTPLISLSLH